MIFSLPGASQVYAGGQLTATIRSYLSDGKSWLVQFSLTGVVWVVVSAITVSTGSGGAEYRAPDFAPPGAAVVPSALFSSDDGVQEYPGVISRASFPAAIPALDNITDDAIRNSVAGMLPASVWNNPDFGIILIPVVNLDGSWSVQVIVTNNGQFVWAFADVNFFFAALIISSITGQDNFGQIINPSSCFGFGCFISNFAPLQSFFVIVSGFGAVQGTNACTFEANKNDGGGPALDSGGDCSFSGAPQGSFTAEHTVEPQFSATSDVHETYSYNFENTTSSSMNVSHWVDITHEQPLSGLEVMGPGTTGCDFTPSETQSTFRCSAVVQPNSGFEDNAYDYWYTANGRGNTHAEAWYQVGNNSPVNYYSYDRFYEERADFQLTKESEGGSPLEGQPYSYSLHMVQTGPSIARNVVVEDDLPEGYTFTSFSGDGTIVQTDNQLAWIVPDLDFNESARVEYLGSYDAIYPCSASTRTNFATVIYTDGLDINATQNSASVETELCPSSASGSLCEDLNGNNQCDIGEPLFPGPTQLYVDHNGDSFFNMSLDQEFVTNLSGLFTVPNLGPGIFDLYLSDNQGIQLTSKPFQITIAATDLTGLEIPVTVPQPPATPGSIHVQKFFDLDGDGIFDQEEHGLNGVNIELAVGSGISAGGGLTHDMDFDQNGVIDPHSERGWIWFEDLQPDFYSLNELVPAGMEVTVPTNNLIEIQLGEGENSVGHLFGNKSVNLDWGDAPEVNTGPSFQTTLANDGARHKINPAFFLGDLVDPEPDGQPDLLAGLTGGDDIPSDDEDGIGVGLGSIKGINRTRTFSVQRFFVGKTAIICAKSSIKGSLDGWIDWGGDNSWSEPGDHVIIGGEVNPAGLGLGSCFDVLVPNVTVPPKGRNIFSRFRLTEQGISTPNGFAPEGEVEDYLAIVAPVVIVTNSGDQGDANPGDGICADSGGQCTLRAFLEEANSKPGLAAMANFLVAGKSSAVTLQPQSPYPAITSPVIILGDGEIEIDGSQAGAGAVGFDIQTDESQIIGLTIHGFDGPGIRISGDNNAVADLTIHDNNGAGVTVVSGTGNSIRTTTIFDNGGLGIDLGVAGVLFNDGDDSDVGVNNLQNYPELLTATAEDGHIVGTLRSVPDAVFGLDFFSSPACDASGNGEGQVFLGTTRVMTDNLGNADIDVFLAVNPFTVGSSITATATDSEGNTSEFSDCLTAITTAIERNPEAEIPQDFTLDQNYPNPFNPVTTIAFGLSRAQFVTIEIFDILGKRVEMLVNERKEPGEYTVTFDAGMLPSGIYLYRMTAGGFTDTKQLTLLK